MTGKIIRLSLDLNEKTDLLFYMNGLLMKMELLVEKRIIDWRWFYSIFDIY